MTPIEFLRKREEILIKVNEHLESQITWCDAVGFKDLGSALVMASRFNLDRLASVQDMMRAIGGGK